MHSVLGNLLKVLVRRNHAESGASVEQVIRYQFHSTRYFCPSFSLKLL